MYKDKRYKFFRIKKESENKFLFRLTNPQISYELEFNKVSLKLSKKKGNKVTQTEILVKQSMKKFMQEFMKFITNAID